MMAIIKYYNEISNIRIGQMCIGQLKLSIEATFYDVGKDILIVDLG